MGSNSEADAGRYEQAVFGESADAPDMDDEEHWIPPTFMVRLPPGVSAADYFGD